ncbi:MAG TPA: glycosyltransferase family A protein [Nitrospirales bacterium]|nr:glycosyltransferase family A protein [Nitrospirales bacterium]
MKPLSIVIPTANDPKLLQTALESVARQTAVHAVEEVIVSENSGRRDSEKVCAQFPDLPITYICHERPLPILEHFLYVYRQARAEFVAFLCDDDWWAPGHLQSALAGLHQHEDAVVSFSACLYLDSEAARHGWISRVSVLWLAAGKPDLMKRWYLTPQEVLAVSALISVFHLSTMVVRREALLRAAQTVDQAHPRQFDQYLYVGLAREGAILYDPLVDTFIRWNGTTNYSAGISMREREVASRACTERIWRDAEAAGLDLTATWQHHIAQAPADVLDEVGQYFRIAMTNEQLVERGFARFLPPPLPIRLARRGRQFSTRAWRYLRRELLTLQ